MTGDAQGVLLELSVVIEGVLNVTRGTRQPGTRARATCWTIPDATAVRGVKGYAWRRGID